ncbi:SprT-like domain-containing protein [Alkalimarinus sediminis]|uniref:SprT-like domain-containing protein n=1 Tax=Alkalimarinus sediminis TaxID=1632866 RepID=A0A9E8KI42_9ALTE|nr:SprT-like domain-containing protein [Alkalimarinus sediminis]UZW73551.1 SprT-like domain-containing protein [Alkalimarinus sediminis]
MPSVADTSKSRLTALQSSMVEAVGDSIKAANDYFGKSLAVPDIRFDLRGKSAGQARFEYQRGYALTKKAKAVIRFNRLLMEENPQAFIEDVAPHETAHVIANQLFGRKIKPHGPEWQMIMRSVLKREPAVTHRFDVSRSSPKPYIYSCDCSGTTHSLSAIRHNRVQRKQSSYLCRRCNATLDYAGPQA